MFLISTSLSGVCSDLCRFWLQCSLRLRLHWSQNRHNTTVLTDYIQGREIKNITVYVSGYNETDTTGMLSPSTVWSFSLAVDINSNVSDFYFLMWSLSRLLCCVGSGFNVAVAYITRRHYRSVKHLKPTGHVMHQQV
jgi:hypothetical protein